MDGGGTSFPFHFTSCSLQYTLYIIIIIIIIYVRGLNQSLVAVKTLLITEMQETI